MENVAPKSERSSPWPPLIGAIFFILPLGHFLFLWMLGASMSAGNGGGRIGVGFGVYLLIITLVPMLLSVVSLRRAENVIQTLCAGATLIVFVLLSVGSVVKLSSQVASEMRSRAYEHQQALLRDWRAFAKRLNPEIAAYIQEHPKSVSKTREGEIIEVSGLMAVLQTRHSDWAIKNGALMDPWNRPVKIGMDLNNDGWIKLGDRGTGVWRPNGSIVAIGVYSAGAEEASGHNGSEWNTEGGVIERKR